MDDGNDDKRYDFNKINEINSEENQPAIISSKNDGQIIEEMMSLHNQFKSIMNQRVKGLETVNKPYKEGKYEESLANVSLCKDLGVVNDVFRYALIKKDLDKISLKSDMVIQIFPTILTMINCKYDAYFKTGISTAWVILNLFSQPIMDAIKAPLSRGIDLNREEKIKKYEVILDYFCKLRDSPRVQNNYKYKEIKGLDLKQFMGELVFFINQCRSK